MTPWSMHGGDREKFRFGVDSGFNAMFCLILQAFFLALLPFNIGNYVVINICT